MKPRRKGKPAPRIKPKRQEDPEHLDAVRDLPCCICGSWPSEAHHIRDGQVGTGQKAGDHEAINLCPACHRTGENAIHHLGTREWERRFGPQREYLKKVEISLATHPAEPTITEEEQP